MKLVSVFAAVIGLALIARAGRPFRRRPRRPLPARARRDRLCRDLSYSPDADRVDGDRLVVAAAGHEPMGGDLGAPGARLGLRGVAAVSGRRLCAGCASAGPARDRGRRRGRQHDRRCHPRILRPARLHRDRVAMAAASRPALAGRRSRSPSASSSPSVSPSAFWLPSAAVSACSIALPARSAAAGRIRRRRGPRALHAAVAAIYARPVSVWASFVLHLVCWIASAAEIWLALRFMNAPRGFGVVLVIESLLYAIRSVAFAVPNAVGVQEGAYILLGARLWSDARYRARPVAVEAGSRLRDRPAGSRRLPLDRKRAPVAPRRRRPTAASVKAKPRSR